MNKYFLTLYLTFFLIPNVAAAQQALFQQINTRLSYMDDVALYKAQNNLPIEDVKREKVVISKAKASAAKQGLAPHSVEDFFIAQISVAKAIQFRYRADLLSRPVTEKARDLNQEIRPHLIQLGDEIIQQMKHYLTTEGSFKHLSFQSFDSAINVQYVTQADKQMLFKAIKKIKLLEKK